MLKKACIIGDPVAHSRSPLIHNFWLKQLGIEGSYERAHVTPDELPNFIKHCKKNGYVGANCTIPHKEIVVKLCDHITPSATAVGAVNTLWFETDKLHGDNSDVTGFLSALDHSALDWDKRTQKAVVIGAGGAARAVVYGLLQRDIAQIYVVNRSVERAQILAEQFGTAITPTPFTDINIALQNADLLINTTSLGMKGQPPLDIDLAPLKPSAIVNDIVYVPLETPLLSQAKARGLTAIGGLDMLLYQAVDGFEHWFGVRPIVCDDLRALIMRDIEG